MTESRKSVLAPVWWTIAALFVVEIFVRFVIDFNLGRVLFAETVSFTAAAVLLNSFSRRSANLSKRARTTVVVFALALVLGAIRSGLWMVGMEVQWANLTILVIALTLFTVWWRRRRTSD